MKKLLALLLVVLLVLSTFAACSSNNSDDTEKDDKEQTEKDTEKDTQKDTQKETEKETEKQTEGSGDNSGNNDAGNNDAGDSKPKAYRFGMTQANVDASKIFYLTGEMSSYYMATTDNMSEALNVYLEATEGGYYLYCMIDDVKTYINMVVNDTHVNGAYEATASTVYTLDEENGTLKANVTVAADETKSGEYWFGTRNDKEYTTVGPVLVKYEGFFCKLYDAANTEDAPVQQPEDDNTGDDNTGDTPACEHVDANGDYKCDKECGEKVLPAADSELTIEQAVKLGEAFEHNTTSGDTLYYVSGTIVSIANAQYGNLTITNGTDSIYVFGTTYPNMDVKPVVGDTITLYGAVGNYNGPQMKNATITEVTAHEHAYENGSCTICGTADPDYVNPCEHVDEDSDYKCDNCGEIMAPAADSVLTIEQAVKLGEAFEHNTTSGDTLYYVSGTIVSIANTQYGNLTITNGTASIYVFGTTYPNMDVKPVVGDTITLYGAVGNYNGPQMKNATITEVTAHEHAYENGSCTICGATDPEYVAPETPETPSYNTLATFEFGENGEANKENSNAITAYEETANDYTLTLENLSKVYDKCSDGLGNSCLKLGTSSVVGSFTFTVNDDVKQVVIKVAKYKAKTSKITINGGEAQTLTNSSNDGLYHEIIVDTTTTKTVNVSTVSGACRIMIDSITFNG